MSLSRNYENLYLRATEELISLLTWRVMCAINKQDVVEEHWARNFLSIHSEMKKIERHKPSAIRLSQICTDLSEFFSDQGLGIIPVLPGIFSEDLSRSKKIAKIKRDNSVTPGPIKSPKKKKRVTAIRYKTPLMKWSSDSCKAVSNDTQKSTYQKLAKQCTDLSGEFNEFKRMVSRERIRFRRSFLNRTQYKY